MGTKSPTRVLCFGEVLLRLSAPPGTVLLQEPVLDVCVGGAEANVAVALARLGSAAAVVSTLPEGALGDAALQGLRAQGVDVSLITRTSGRVGLYFLTTGGIGRAANVIYDRAGSAFALRPAPADWAAALAGATRLHLSGITPALSESCAIEALQAAITANKLNLPVSFDGNFRSQLWAARAVDPAPILRSLVETADLLFGNHRDLALLLGRPATALREDAMAAFKAFPRLRAIASTARTVDTPDRHRLSARIDTPERVWEVPEVEVSGIVDRIGTGDAFVAGVLHDLPKGAEMAVQTGHALAVMKHGFKGDFCLATERDLADFRAGRRDVVR